mmetsp:Transcript_6311/g.9212  ORF Transcript_6311/g.9212 Transcript_6311/m.9212 type:complete len:81 (-) Transcript_6311:67-309(-)
MRLSCSISITIFSLLCHNHNNLLTPTLCEAVQPFLCIPILGSTPLICQYDISPNYHLPGLGSMHSPTRVLMLCRVRIHSY